MASKLLEKIDNGITTFGQTGLGSLLGGAEGIKKGLGNMASIGANVLNASADKGLGLTAGQSATKNAISNVIGKFGLAGKAFQFGAAAMDWLGSKTGHAITNIDKNQAKLAGITGAQKAVNTLKSIPGLGLFLQGKKLTGGVEQEYALNNYGKDDYITGNLLFGLKGAQKWNDTVQGWNTAKNIIGEQAELDLNNSSGELYAMQNANRFSGFRPNLILGKSGMKFPELDAARLFLNQKTKVKSDVEKFQLGGKMNIIPDGALHKNKNHLEEMDPNLEGQITTKGIPVVSTDENTGEVTQYAEIEKEEWTLCKEVTDKLEDLYKQYNENPSDEIAIECGKFIEFQLLKNTDDQVGLRKEVV